MNCNFDKEMIHKYLDNSMDPLEFIILKEHIAVCQHCKLELELMSKLEDSMHQYFDSLPDNELLEDFTMKVLDQCYTEHEKTGFVQGVAKAWKINKMIAANSVRYTDYLPGSKLAVSTVKKAGSGMNKAVKSYMKNSFRKLITGAVK